MPHMITRSHMQLPVDAVVNAGGRFTRVPPKPYRKADGTTGTSPPAIMVGPGAEVDTEKIDPKRLARMLDKPFPALIGMETVPAHYSPSEHILATSMPKTAVYNPEQGLKIDTDPETPEDTAPAKKAKRPTARAKVRR